MLPTGVFEMTAPPIDSRPLEIVACAGRMQ